MWSIGIDLHKKTSHLCVQDESGKVVFEKCIRTKRERFEEELSGFQPGRVLLESSTSSEWVARTLEQLGFTVIVGDPSFAATYATRTRKVKSDKRDARALSDACRMNTYRPAHRVSDEKQRFRELLGTHRMLVHQRTSIICRVRSLFERLGEQTPTCDADLFRRRVREQGIPVPLRDAVNPLLDMLAMLEDQLKVSERMLERHAASDEVTRRLQTIPGVGASVSLSFVATLDRIGRFEGARQAACYLGLTPSESSTGGPEVHHRGAITKVGAPEMRAMLVQAGWSLVRSKDANALPLQQWFARISERHGAGTAVVGLARKLACVMFAMWRDGTTFNGEKTKMKEGMERLYKLAPKAKEMTATPAP
jgi:transposase